jgi:hypothetical protein
MAQPKKAATRSSTLKCVGVLAEEEGSLNAVCGTRHERVPSLSKALKTRTSFGVMSR